MPILSRTTMLLKKRCIDEKQIVEIKWKGGKEQQKTKNKEEKGMQIAL